MQHSKLTQAGIQDKLFQSLKVLNLSHSLNLTKTPDFLKLENLEQLILQGCKELLSVHESIGTCNKLVLANFANCGKLRRIPGSICTVETFKNLNISGCSKIEKLLQDLQETRSVVLMDGTAIEHLKILIEIQRSRSSNPNATNVGSSSTPSTSSSSATPPPPTPLRSPLIPSRGRRFRRIGVLPGTAPAALTRMIQSAVPMTPIFRPEAEPQLQINSGSAVLFGYRTQNHRS